MTMTPVLFSDEDVTITALDSELRAPGDGMSLAIRNDTNQDLVVYTQELLVNGYLLPDAGFYCDLPKPQHLCQHPLSGLPVPEIHRFRHGGKYDLLPDVLRCQRLYGGI